MKRVTINDINWDTDGEIISLPQEVVYVMEDDELQDPNYIADRLSDEYGFCVFGYLIASVEDLGMNGTTKTK